MLGIIHPIVIIIIIVVVLLSVSVCCVRECVEVVVAAEQFAGLARERERGSAEPAEGASDRGSLFLLVPLPAQRVRVLLLPHAPQWGGGTRDGRKG